MEDEYMSDEECKAEERGRAARREKLAHTPLTPIAVMMLSGSFVVRTDDAGAIQESFCGIPLAQILAACPIPAGTMATVENARAVLARWDAYVHEQQMKAAVS